MAETASESDSSRWPSRSAVKARVGRLAALLDASGASLGAFVCDNVTPGSVVHTDGWRGYTPLAGLGYDHRPVPQRRHSEERQIVLPRAHRALSNLKTWLHGTHRSASPKHLSVYLDEFVFRHNRRRTPMAAFQTLLGLGTVHEPTTYHEITGRATTTTYDPQPDGTGYPHDWHINLYLGNLGLA